MDLQPLASSIFAALRRMDDEATTVASGKRTGLWSYGYHARPDLRRPQTEPEWSKRLAALLTAAGFPSRPECRYPGLPAGQRNSCDVVVELPSGGRLWLELKGAWRDYWAAKGNLFIYRSYLLHPLVPDLDPKSHTLPHDLTKLGRLSPDEASAVAALLIGFEADGDPMDADVQELVRLARLDASPWVEFSDRWAASHAVGHHVRCWLWARPVVMDEGTRPAASPAPVVRETGRRTPSKYGPLQAHLEALPGPGWATTFAELERILGLPLPASAAEHRSWWANSRSATSPQVRSWLDAGWHVSQVDMSGRTVSFARTKDTTTGTRDTPARGAATGRSARTLQRTEDRVAELCAGFAGFLDAFEAQRRFTGPSVHFHEKTLGRLVSYASPGTAVQDDEFVDLIYATLTAWGMHRLGPGGAKLTEIDRFRAGLRRHSRAIDGLAGLRLEEVPPDEVDAISTRLWRIVDDLDSSATGTTLVAGTKVLHHVLPELVPPMDREYTLQFFFGNKVLGMGSEAAFKQLFPLFCRIARECATKTEAARGRRLMSQTTPKIIDNAIVGYVLTRLASSHDVEEPVEVDDAPDLDDVVADAGEPTDLFECRVLDATDEIAQAQRALEDALRRAATRAGPLPLGWQGGGRTLEVLWLGAEDLWVAFDDLGTRWWNAFGLGNPFEGASRSIVVEVNPPTSGRDRTCAGAFVMRGDQRVLVHTGRIGGGRPGINREAFLQAYAGPKVQVGDETFLLVAEVESPRAPSDIARFVRAVHAFKESARAAGSGSDPVEAG